MLVAFFDTLISALTYQLIGVALFLPLELALPKTRASFGVRASGFIFLLAVAPVTAVVAAGIEGLRDALGIVPVLHFHGGFGSAVVAAVVAALWVDLQFYLVHRLEHRFLWRFHAVHHSIRHLSAANSYHHWTEPLMGLPLAIPLLFVDVQIGPAFVLLAFLFRFQQFYIHSSAGAHFGPLRWLLVDNRYHRIHHSVEPQHHDRNFGAMSPLWDWLFGTLHMPKSSEWPDVGLKDVDQPAGLADWSSLPWRLGDGPGLRDPDGPSQAADRPGRREGRIVV